MKDYKISIFRFDPTVDQKPAYVTYPLKADVRLTVLSALGAVCNEYGEDIAYRSSCLMGRCGSCAVMLNGLPVLACQTALEPGKSTIGPLSSYPIIRDLIIDRSQYEQAMVATRSFLDVAGARVPERLFYGADMYPLASCTECLVCQSSCPSRRASPTSFRGPAIMTQIARYGADPKDYGERARIAITESMYSCTSCMTCSEVCPKGIDVFGKAINGLRQMAVKNGHLVPDEYSKMAEQFRLTGLAMPSRSETLVSELSRQPTPSASSSALKVGVFLGCMFSVKHQDMGRALVRSLNSAGIETVVPGGQVCCGGPLLWTGYSGEARQAMEQNVRVFNDAGVDTVVTGCSGCGLMWKREYPRMTHNGDTVPRFSVADVSEVLAERSSPGNSHVSEGDRICYFTPCHLKGQSVHHEPLAVLQQVVQNAGASLIDVDLPSCCGGMALNSDERLAARLASEVISAAQSRRADALVTSCPFCVDNLSRAARRARSKMRVIHLVNTLEV